jgi:hypothetical protein
VVKRDNGAVPAWLTSELISPQRKRQRKIASLLLKPGSRLLLSAPTQQLRQPRDVDGDPPRLVFVSAFACRASASFSREER